MNADLQAKVLKVYIVQYVWKRSGCVAMVMEVLITKQYLSYIVTRQMTQSTKLILA